MSKLKTKTRQKVDKDAPDIEQFEQESYKKNNKQREENSYVHFNTPMDFMFDVVAKFRVKNENRNNEKLDIIDILKPIEKGKKAQKYIIDNVINKTLDAKNKIMVEKNSDSEDAEENIMTIEKNIIDDFKKMKITENEIITLIKRCYDDHVKVRSHEKVNKIDERLHERKGKSKLLSWIFEAHRKTFLNALKHSTCGESEILKQVENDYIPKEGEEVYELYGKHYIKVKFSEKRKSA